jgi:O-antigen/teichoic acid export membrane protein
MSALPQPMQGPTRLRPVQGRGPNRIARASAWTLSSMVAMSLLRLVSQMVLTYLCLPEHFGVVMMMRTFLTLVEMTSDMGLRNAVISHPRGEERAFLGTAFSVQLLRGIAMWLITCLLAWPAAAFYDASILLWLLPIAGLESVNNGLFSVRAYVYERRLSLAVPTLLDVLGLLVSVGTSILWAWFYPGPWALALGPLVGGAVRALASHLVFRAERVRFMWEPAIARELFAYSRWIIGSTTVSFVAQQFHMLFLPKFLSKAMFGVYGLAWNLCVQATKPMTALANRVIIPHLAEAHRDPELGLGQALRASANRFLPACLLVCVGAGLIAPAMFELLYSDSFADGGPLGQVFAIVVWFMILQQVPRCTLLSIGDARGVATMAGWNAALTVVGVLCGYLLFGGSLRGAIIGNAVGNVAGCFFGWRGLLRHGLHAGRPMVLYSLGFLALLATGVFLTGELVQMQLLTLGYSSVAATATLGLPLAMWVWFGTVAPLRKGRAARG